MEKRALLAIALSVGILLAWQAFFAPPAVPPPPPSAPERAPSAAAPAPMPGASAAAGLSARPAAVPSTAIAAEVSSPLYRITFGPDGSVTAWRLRYRGDKPIIVGGTLGPLAVGLARAGQGIEVVALHPASSRVTVVATEPPATLAFDGVTREGVRVRKVLRFSANSYAIDVDLQVEGPVADASPWTVALYWTSPVAQIGATREAPWLTFGEGKDHEQLLGRILVAPRGDPLATFEAPAPALKDPKESPGGPELKDPHLVSPDLGGEGGWVGLENDYFLAALFGGDASQLWRGRERDLTETALVFPGVRADQGRRWEGRAQLYVGPKEWTRLKAVGVGLEQAQARNYGYFLWLRPWVPMWWFCVPLLWLMNFFGTHIPGQNYGVAIILLTVLVKALFYPLTRKSMSSMKQMQALQPQLNALRSKYRSDPQRFQREQMELFRKYKVNPMGGCLPMVVQIPIFYALYLTLQYSVELQGAHFLLWITDLSKKDPYYVLPILMGVSMLWQQKMTPTVGDPRQAKMMLIMPVIFTFMFLEFPTGLVLYWLVNNVLSITQQYLIDRAAARSKALLVDGKAEKEPRRA